MKTHKLIALRFWIKSDVNPLCVDKAHISLVLNLSGDPLSKDPTTICYNFMFLKHFLSNFTVSK